VTETRKHLYRMENIKINVIGTEMFIAGGAHV